MLTHASVDMHEHGNTSAQALLREDRRTHREETKRALRCSRELASSFVEVAEPEHKKSCSQVVEAQHAATVPVLTRCITHQLVAARALAVEFELEQFADLRRHSAAGAMDMGG